MADYPAAYFYRRLLKVSPFLRTLLPPPLEVFPEARVVLTKRTAESWQRSMRSSLLKVPGGPGHQPVSRATRTELPSPIEPSSSASTGGGRRPWLTPRFLRGLDKLYDILDSTWMAAVRGSRDMVGLGELPHTTPHQAEEFCHQWEAGVREAVAPDRLLVFQVSLSSPPPPWPGGGGVAAPLLLPGQTGARGPLPQAQQRGAVPGGLLQVGHHRSPQHVSPLYCRFRHLTWLMLASCLLLPLLSLLYLC